MALESFRDLGLPKCVCVWVHWVVVCMVVRIVVRGVGGDSSMGNKVNYISCNIIVSNEIER